jgi:hypothetical protein
MGHTHTGKSGGGQRSFRRGGRSRGSHFGQGAAKGGGCGGLILMVLLGLIALIVWSVGGFHALKK